MNARILLSTLHASTAAIALMLAAPVQADIGDPNSKCTDSDAAEDTLNPSYVDCSAHYDDVPAPQTTLVAPFVGYGDFQFFGQTKNDNSDSGPFHAFGPDLKVGALTLDTAQHGPFVIALASFNDYSLYLYDATGISGGVMTIEFSTLGTTNAFFQPYELEYANLYAPVPEPSAIALMLAGLAATALALRRRKA